jgi:hypothetical protein
MLALHCGGVPFGVLLLGSSCCGRSCIRPGVYGPNEALLGEVLFARLWGTSSRHRVPKQ